MPSGKKNTPARQKDDALVDVLQNLTQELRVLRDVLDEIREQVSWGLRNDGFRRDECLVLKQMGRDATAHDWGEKLVIVGDEPSTESGDADQSQELDAARKVIRELLKLTELNLDDLDEGTRQAIERARDAAWQPVEPASDGDAAASGDRVAEPAEPNVVAPSSRAKGPQGQLF